jgi:hypothetical protein
VRHLVVAGLAVLAASCSSADTAPPVGTVSFTANKTRVALNSPIELTYRFDVAPSASFPGDFRVLVHVVDADGNQMWSDDHDPPIPTSQWKPGQTIQYTRTRFVPVFPYLGEAVVKVGLYRNDERLPLQGPDAADRESTSREYRVGTLQLLPTSENIFTVRKSGWHPVEYSPENPQLEWYWTQKTAVLTFRNPRRDILFYVEYDARTDLFPNQPQQVSVYSGSQVVGTFVADDNAPMLEKIPITAAQLGTNEMAELRLEVDRTFTPAKLPGGGRDPRELGIRVYHDFVEVR